MTLPDQIRSQLDKPIITIHGGNGTFTITQEQAKRVLAGGELVVVGGGAVSAEFSNELIADLLYAAIEQCDTAETLREFMQGIWTDGEVLVIPHSWSAKNSDDMSLTLVVYEDAPEREKQKAVWLADFLLSLDGSRSVKFNCVHLAYAKEHTETIANN